MSRGKPGCLKYSDRHSHAAPLLGAYKLGPGLSVGHKQFDGCTLPLAKVGSCVCLQASGASQQQDMARKQANAASLQLSASAVFMDSILAPGAEHVQALGLLEGLLRVSGFRHDVNHAIRSILNTHHDASALPLSFLVMCACAVAFPGGSL